MEFFKQMFSLDFMPHGFCYLWNPRIVWLNLISDDLIALVPLVPKVFSLPEWIL
ncbi:MAG: hypothetical protein WBD25_00300 [Terriglobales bacterium]|jgi:hypothetical protein